MAMREVRTALLEEPGGEHDRGRANWDVDEEDPRPAEIGGEHSAEQDADRRSAARRRRVNPEREVAVATLGERGHEQREGGRGEKRAAESLRSPEDDQGRLRPRDAAKERT